MFGIRLMFLSLASITYVRNVEVCQLTLDSGVQNTERGDYVSPPI